MKNQQANQMYQMYSEGYSLEQIGKVWGVTRQSVYEMFKVRRFELRKKKELPPIVWNGAKYTLDKNGYYQKTNDGRSWLHQDVWEYTYGPVPNGYVIHHKDSNRTNNAVENLECMTIAHHNGHHRYPQKIEEKYCLYCKKLLARKSHPGGQIERPARIKKKKYCNAQCHGAHSKGKPRNWKASFV